LVFFPREQSSNMSRAVTVKDVPANLFIAEYATHLKKNQWLKLPEWVDYVKTGFYKELCPQDPDWYYIRAASIARKIYLRQGTGIGTFQDVYGGPNRRGPRPTHHAKASGAVIRHVIKQLEAIGVVEKIDNKKGGGRKITTEGQRDLDRIAGRVNNKTNPRPKKEKKPKTTQSATLQ